MAKTMVVYSLPVTSFRLKKSRYHFVKCWIIVGLTVLSLVSAQTTPQNTAVNAGTPETYLNCSYPRVNQSLFIWQFINFTTGTSNFVALACSSFYPQLYEVDCSTQNTVNLIILNAQVSQAGRYTCSPGDQPTSSSQFIVLGGDVTCSTDPTVEVPVSQSVQLSCETQVYGNIKPVISWTSSGTIVPSNPSDSGANIGATATVWAQIPTVPSHICSTKFNTGTSSATATNIPTYTSNCNTQPLQVLYPPSSATITLDGNPNTVSCTDTLTCSAVSYPASTYTWTLPDGSSVTETTIIPSQTGQTGTNLTYACTASNSQGSAQASIALNVTYCRYPNVANIVGGSIGGLAYIILTILVICCCVKSCPLYKCCRGKQLKEEQSSSSFSSGIYDVPHDVTDSPPVYEAVTEYDYIGNEIGIWTCNSSKTIYLRPPLPRRHHSFTDLPSQNYNLSVDC